MATVAFIYFYLFTYLKVSFHVSFALFCINIAERWPDWRHKYRQSSFFGHQVAANYCFHYCWKLVRQRRANTFPTGVWQTLVHAYRKLLTFLFLTFSKKIELLCIKTKKSPTTVKCKWLNSRKYAWEFLNKMNRLGVLKCITHFVYERVSTSVWPSSFIWVNVCV